MTENSASLQPPTAVLAINLGTPKAPTAAAVRDFLRPFLSDRRVVDLPRWLWAPILNFLILPLRPRRSAQNYAAIWWPEGAPLRVISTRQAAALESLLCAGDHSPLLCVLPAASYGRPSLAEAARTACERGARRILVLPMYPQYSDSTVGAVADQLHVLRGELPEQEFGLILEHCANPLYIRALAEQLRSHWREHGRAERLLLSFHGLPLSRVERAGDPYAWQCRYTAALLAAELGLSAAEYALCFQSRFGFAPWMQPYTDRTLEAWGKSGLKSVDVFCPGFSADCLETLEEIDVENREIFQSAGGGEYRFVACLNDTPAYMECLAELIREQLHSPGVFKKSS